MRGNEKLQSARSLFYASPIAGTVDDEEILSRATLAMIDTYNELTAEEKAEFDAMVIRVGVKLDQPTEDICNLASTIKRLAEIRAKEKEKEGESWIERIIRSRR